MSENHGPSAARPGCDRFQAQLSARLLDELEGPARQELDAHTAACAECRGELELLRVTVDAIAVAVAVARKPAPGGEALEPTRRRTVLRAAAGSSSARPSTSRRRAYWMASLAAAALVLVCAVPVLLQQYVSPPGGNGPEIALVQPRTPVSDAYRDGVIEDIAVFQKRAEDYLGKPSTRRKALPALPATAAEGEPDVFYRGDANFDRAPRSFRRPLVEAQRLEETSAASDEAQLQSRGGSVRSASAGSRSSVAPTPGRASGRAFGVSPAADKETAARRVSRYSSLYESSEALPERGRTENPTGASAEKHFKFLAQQTEILRSAEPVDAKPEATLKKRVGLSPADNFGSATGPAGELKLVDGRMLADEAGQTAHPFGFGEPTGVAPQDAAGAALAGGDAAKAATPEPAQPEEHAETDAPEPPPARPDVRILIDNVLSKLDRRPGEKPDMMFFRYFGDNPFVETARDPRSTFAVDVDTASYTLMRSYLFKHGVLPPTDAIRTEEFVNYFRSHYPPPATDQGAFAIHTELAPSPFAHQGEYRLLKVGVKGREVTREERKPASLVFVVDTSGSMRRENRLELVKEALGLLVEELDEGDTIGIVRFDTSAQKILDPTPASDKERILDAIGTLHPSNNTNVHAGLTMGYAMAASNLIEGGSNRVLLLSDGVANTSITDPDRMLQAVVTERQRGIYLTCIGVGMGNHNDVILEQLARNGDGQCVYVDRLDEARKVFVDNLTGTLEAIARDVKIQVEFNKDNVLRYRLLGYENRALADAAFRDNTVDAGEVGAGHEVTALYEIKPAPDVKGHLATVRVRYLTVEEREAVELEHAIDATVARANFTDASVRFQLAALVAEFAEILRDSYWARESDLQRVAGMTRNLLGDGPRKLGSEQEVVELVALMERADALVKRRRAARDEVALVVDMIKENDYQRSRLADATRTDREADRSHLEDLERLQDALRQRLEQVLGSR